MKAIETKIRTIILSDTTVTSLIGNKFFPIVAPQGTPGNYCTYQTFGVSVSTTKRQRSQRDRIRFRIDCISESFQTAVDIADAIRNKIEKYGDEVIDEILYIDHIDDFDTGDREDSRLYRRQVDFDILYQPYKETT